MHFHKWDKWEVYEKGSITYSGGKVAALIIIQKKICKKCGEIRLREEWSN